jgi:hypothetical protein
VTAAPAHGGAGEPLREVLFVAGEASGDLHAAGVAAELARLRPDLALTGVGGSRMRDAGVELLEDMGRMAVMGFVEVLRHVPAHYALLRRLRARLRSGRVALLVLVDYPGFNLRVAAEARRAGVPVLYFITPQVWAWRRHRLRGMARVITRAAVILPFEEKLLRGAGIDAAFVGHPLLDRATALPDDPAEAAARLGLEGRGPLLALFPGKPRAGDRATPRRVRRDGAAPRTGRAGAARGGERGAHGAHRPGALPVPARRRRARSCCCGPRPPRCARAARRRSKRRWPGARSSSRTARAGGRTRSRGAWSRSRGSGS